MGIPIPPPDPSPVQMSPTRETEVDFEQDAHLKKMLERKHKLEEAEVYNSPETMLKKRKAVQEQALSAPRQRSPSTDLQFDDDIHTAVADPKAEASKEKSRAQSRAEKVEAKKTPNHRTARRSRTAARRREAKTKATAGAEAGHEQGPEQAASTTRRGRKRLRRLADDKQQLSTQLEA